MPRAAKKPKVKAGTSKQSAEARKMLFAQALLSNGGNKRKAALEAGFSETTADKAGQRLAKDGQVMSYIRQQQDSLAKKYELTAESVIAELAKIVHADLRSLYGTDGNLLHPKDWPDGVAGAVAGVEFTEEYESGPDGRKPVGVTKKLKLWDKNAAIDKAMKHLGLFERDNEQKQPEALDEVSTLELARRIAFVFRKGVEETRKGA